MDNGTHYAHRALVYISIDERLLYIPVRYKSPNTPYMYYIFDSSPPEQDGRHFADGIVRCIFVNEKLFFFYKIFT